MSYQSRTTFKWINLFLAHSICSSIVRIFGKLHLILPHPIEVKSESWWCNKTSWVKKTKNGVQCLNVLTWKTNTDTDAAERHLRHFQDVPSDKKSQLRPRIHTLIVTLRELKQTSRNCVCICWPLSSKKGTSNIVQCVAVSPALFLQSSIKVYKVCLSLVTTEESSFGFVQ